MRKSLLLACVLSLALAVTAHAAESGKVAVFNSRAVAAKSTALIEAQKKIEGQFAAERTALERQSEELKKRAEELQTKSAALSPEAREDKRTEFLRKKRDFEDRYQAFARKAEAASMRLQQEFGSQLFKAAQEYGSRKGYSILLDSAMGGPIFYDKSADVTSDMIEEINRVYKTSTAASAPPAAAAPAARR